MKKWILGLLLLVIALAGVAILMLDRIVATAVEQGGSAATGVPTRVGSVDAGFFQGHLGLRTLTVDNPPGYSNRKFLACEELRAEWDNGTLLDPKIHVRQLKVRGLELELERTDKGGNWSKLLEKMSSGRQEPAQRPADGEARSLQIDSIVLEDVRCGLTLTDAPLVGGRKELKLPRLEIKGLQTDGDAAHIAGVVLEALIDATLEELARSGADFLPKDVLKDVQGELKKAETKLRKELEGGLRKLLDPLK